MTNWHDSPVMIVKSADPQKDSGASFEKMRNEVEALLVNGYAVKSMTKCNGQIFVVFINESESRIVSNAHQPLLNRR